MSILVIVESPGKIKKIGAVLGSEYIVMASVGHIRDLSDGGLDGMGFSPPNFKPIYKPMNNKKQVISNLVAAAKNADKVIIASDPDREGEAIAWHVAEILNLTNPDRITFNGLTPNLINSAINNPRKIDQNLVYAQETRRILDRMIGWQVSASLRNSIGNLSAGRVQTVAVRLVFDRENEIKKFQPIEHYSIHMHFDGWKATIQLSNILEKNQNYLLDRSYAEQIATLRSFVIKNYQEVDKLRSPDAPFTTSSLQIEAANRLGFSTKKTMEIAQKLYEQGFITYHRTDAPNLVQEGEENIKSYLLSNNLSICEASRSWKAKEGAQEGHEAIRPTSASDTYIGETEDQKKLYKLIWSRAIASQMEDAIYSVRNVEIETEFEGKIISFKSSGSVLKTAGWLAIYQDQLNSSNDDIEEEENETIPVLTPGQNLIAIDGSVVKKITKPKPRFKEQTLIKEMEKRSIGRPSTYAAIIEKIFSCKYVECDSKKNLIPTKIGEALCLAVIGKFQFCEYEYTKLVETKLDDIAEGNKTFHDVISAEWKIVQDNIKQLEQSPLVALNPCPNCEKPLQRRKGTNGFFWGCSGYPDCKTSLPDDNGIPGEKKTPPINSNFKCIDCCKPLIHKVGKSQKTKKNYDFFTCSGYPDCKTTYQTLNNQPNFEGKK